MATTSADRHVSATLQAQVQGPARLELQVALTQVPGLEITERLSVLVDGTPVEPQEMSTEHGTRVHLLENVTGTLTVGYTADVTGRGEPLPVTEQDLLTYRRASRYAESDRLLGFAAKQFGSRAGTDLLADVASWVGSHLNYVPGSSGPTDGATDTLLGAAGVCRDYAHLVIAMLRAREVPARLVAVYAPGCDPMDFHAVVEAAVDGQWQCLDATCLAPRQSMLRISTGRDAADTAFLTNYSSGLVLESSVVTAVVDGDLPLDDVSDIVCLG